MANDPYAGMTQEQIRQLWRDNPYMEWATGKDYRTPEQLAVASIFDRLAAGEQIPGWTYNPATTYKSSGDSEQEFSEPATAQYGGQLFLQGGFQQQNDSLGDVFKDVAKLAAIMGTAYLGGTALAGGFGGGAAGTAAGTAGTGGSTLGSLGSVTQLGTPMAEAAAMGSSIPVANLTAGLPSLGTVGTAAGTASSAASAFRPSMNYGPGMTGVETGVYDTAINATGNPTLAKLANDAVGSIPGGLLKNVLPIAGGLLGTQKAPDRTQSQTNRMDPRMDALVYGSGPGDTNSFLGAAQDWFKNNRSGMNDTMRQALEQQRASYTNPQFLNQLSNARNVASGLLSMPIAGNPFTRG